MVLAETRHGGSGREIIGRQGDSNDRGAYIASFGTAAMAAGRMGVGLGRRARGVGNGGLADARIPLVAMDATTGRLGCGSDGGGGSVRSGGNGCARTLFMVPHTVAGRFGAGSDPTAPRGADDARAGVRSLFQVASGRGDEGIAGDDGRGGGGGKQGGVRAFSSAISSEAAQDGIGGNGGRREGVRSLSRPVVADQGRGGGDGSLAAELAAMADSALATVLVDDPSEALSVATSLVASRTFASSGGGARRSASAACRLAASGQTARPPVQLTSSPPPSFELLSFNSGGGWRWGGKYEWLCDR